MIENNPFIEKLIMTALEEDAAAGDVTSESILAPDAKGRAELLSRSECVLAGIPVFKKVFELVSAETAFEVLFPEGALIGPDERICVIEGPLMPILKAERTALNFLQRMSGIATQTMRYVQKAVPYGAMVLDTRKTVPGLRLLDKYAVKTGGGRNHRLGLFDGILIKDNHIAAAGSIKQAIELARANSPHTLKVEIEVVDIAGVRQALEGGADIIMLDNMGIDQMKEAVMLVDKRAVIEASGNITLDNIEEVAKTGVDFISVGALTHSVKAADLSLEIIG